MDSPKTYLILNPNAQNGRAGKMEATLRQLLNKYFPDGRLLKTEQSWHATVLTQNAIQSGAELIIAAGGDGTMHEVVNGFFAGGKSIAAHCRLGLINFGTGHDFSRSIRLPKGLTAQFERLQSPANKVDVGQVRYVDAEGQAKERYFINECQVGLGGYVALGMQQGMKKLGGKLAFGLSALQQALARKAQMVQVQIDDGPLMEHSVLALVCANGAYMGGGMYTTPDADLQDGLLDILFVKKMNIAQRLINFPKIYTGSHLRSRFIELVKGTALQISSPGKVPLEADGEFLGYLPAEVRVLPQALCLMTG